MAIRDLIALFVKPLSQSEIPYIISGSVAAMQYGEPRLTMDVDFAIVLKTNQLSLLASLYPQPEYYVPPQEILEIERTRPSHGHFNVIHSGTGLKADFYPSMDHPLMGWAFRNKRIIQINDIQAAFSPPEYVILRKLEFLRESSGSKHVRDITSMLDLSGTEINKAFIEENVKELGLEKEWKKISESMKTEEFL